MVELCGEGGRYERKVVGLSLEGGRYQRKMVGLSWEGGRRIEERRWKGEKVVGMSQRWQNKVW